MYGLLLMHMQQIVLAWIYREAMRVRRAYWRVRRPMLIGVRVLIVDGDTVLLIRHRAGRLPWALPGGGVDRDERMIDAARREAAEETGVAVQIERLLGVYDNFHNGVTNCVVVFVATPLNAPRVPRSLEIAEARYFPLADLPDGLENGSRQRIIEYAAGAHGITGLWWQSSKKRT